MGDLLSVGAGGGVELSEQPYPLLPPQPGFSLTSLTVHPDASKVYAGNDNSDNRPAWIFRTSDYKWTTPFVVGNGPTFTAITPDGTKLYVSNYYDSTVDVIDTSDNSIITTIPGFSNPQDLAVTPDGTTVYVADFGASQVLRIDVASDTLIGSPIACTGLTQYLKINPAGTKVYVSIPAGGANAMQVISTASNTVVASIPTAGAPTILAARNFDITPDGTRVYLANANNNTLVRIDATTDTKVSAIALGVGGAQDCGISLDGLYAYVMNTSGIITKVEIATDTIDDTLSFFGAFAIEMDPGGLVAYLLSSSYYEVFVLNLGTFTVTNIINTVVAPAITPLGTFRELLFKQTRMTDLGGGAMEIELPVVFDNATPGTYTNIRSARDDQSIIDNTKNWITNFGSDNGSGNGATGEGSTIGGGVDNLAGPDGYETVAGGSNNRANQGYAFIGGGQGNEAGFGSVIGGGENNEDNGSLNVICGGSDHEIVDSDGCGILSGTGNLITGGE